MATINGSTPSNAVRQMTQTSKRLLQAPAENKYETLVSTLLPGWFVNAPESVRQSLKKSLQLRHETQQITSGILAAIKPIEQFCEPLLKLALSVYGWSDLDVKTHALKQVHLVNNLLVFIARYQVKLVDTAARSLMPDALIPESLELNLVSSISHHSLLQAAMQNFDVSETRAGGFDPGSYIYGIASNKSEVINPDLTPEKFAQISRDLNLGFQYQLHLDQQFRPVENQWPMTDPRSKAFKNMQAFSDNARHEFSCALHMEFMKGLVSPGIYTLIERLLTAQPSVFTTGPAMCGTFQILDFEVTGVIIVLPLRKASNVVQPCVVYLPQAPERCFYEFETFNAFQTHLREWLKNPEFAEYFIKRVPLRHRAEFVRRTHIRHATWDSLLLRRPPIIYEPALFTHSHYNLKSENPFEVAWQQQLAQIKDDASVLVVPTEDEDQRARVERQAMYLNIGISVFGLALGFVPVLGQVLLAVSVIELGEEVFAGIQAWERDDTYTAITYLFDVAQNVALLAGTAGVAKALQAPAHVDAMVPVRIERGISKLWKPDLAGYEVKRISLEGIKADARGIYTVNEHTYIKLDDRVYGVAMEPGTDSFYLKHPTDGRAYKVKLRHNHQGIWTHELDNPLYWDRAQLFRRMGVDAQALSNNTLDKVMTISNLSDATLRHGVLELLPAPALWVDSLKRAALVEKIETFVSRMKNGAGRLAADADLQLRLITQLPGWPADRVLRVVENDGVLFREYGNDLVSRIPRLQVTEAQIANSDLLKVTLDCLSKTQITQLLGREVVGEHEQIQALAQRLGTFAQATEKTLFLSLYNETEATSSIGALIQQQFSSLPAAVVEELVEHLSPEQVALIQSEGRLPLVVLEEARHYVQTVRISRAIEGLLFDVLSSDDSLNVARKILPSVPGWPRHLRLVVRDKTTGHVIETFGNPLVTSAREVFKSGDHYEYFGFAEGETYTHTSLLRCIFETLSKEERTGLMLPATDPYGAFTLKLATVANRYRSLSAQALGLHTIKPWIKSPLRLADGRLGYPLGGRSGRLLPQERPQLLKDQLLELYPSMSEAQAGHFLYRLNLNPGQITRALVSLKGELQSLRVDLDSWVASEVWSAPHNAPRFKVSTHVKKSMRRALIQAWRRQTPHNQIGGHLGYELDLDAWPVDCLPELSADFSHINALNVSHSPSGHFPASFLGKFKQLRALTLKNSELIALPAAIADMSELTMLNLQGNHITLSASAHQTLASLTRLKSLNLTGNGLGMRLSVGRLSGLEHLQLRFTGIDQWPDGIERLQNLQVVDLRDNAISHVPSEVLSPTRNAVNRVTFLHDNPLSTDSLRRLYIYRLEQNINFGIWITRQHVPSPRGVQRWAQPPSDEQLAVWNALWAEDNGHDFFRVLEDLSASAQFSRNYGDLSERVWSLLTAMHQNSGLRTWLFDVSSQPRTCVDGIAMVFADLELQLHIYLAEHGLNTEEQLLDLTRGLFRIESLNQHVDTVIAQRIAQISARPISAVQRLQQLIDEVSPDFADQPLSDMSAQECQGVAYRLGTPEALELAEILSPRWLQDRIAQIDPLEVQMYYQVHLAQDLDLPARPRGMVFENVASVTSAELEEARAYVMNKESPETLKASLIARDYWQNFLKLKYQETFFRSDDTQDERMAALFAARESMSSSDYFRQSQEIVGERESARLALVKRLTEQEIAENPRLMAVLQPPGR